MTGRKNVRNKVKKQNLPLKVSFHAVTGTWCHRHRVHLSHDTPGHRFQLSVDSFHPHETWLTLKRAKSKLTFREFTKWTDFLTSKCVNYSWDPATRVHIALWMKRHCVLNSAAIPASQCHIPECATWVFFFFSGYFFLWHKLIRRSSNCKSRRHGTHF